MLARVAAALLLIPLMFLPVALSQDKSPYVGPVKKDGKKTTYSLKIGDKGNFGDHVYKVDSIDTVNSVVLKIGTFRFEVVVDPMTGEQRVAMLTTGAAVQMKGEWHVKQTTRRRGRTIHLVEAWKDADLLLK